MMRNIGLVILFFSIFIFPVTASDEDLTYGVTITRSISSPREVDSYTFSATKGDVIVLRMVRIRGNLSPEITLYGPSGSGLASDGGTTSSEIYATLPSTGTYSVTAGDDSGLNTGDYIINIQKVNNPGNAEKLSFGTFKTQSINTPGDITTYTFSASAGDNVYIKMVDIGHSLSPELRLFSPDGMLLKTEWALWSTRLFTTLPTSGIYTLIAGEYTGLPGPDPGLSQGNYSIFLQRLNNPVNSEKIQFGDVKIASITKRGEADTYTFQATPGMLVLIKMVEGTFSLSPEVTLYSPSGNQIRRETASTSLEMTVNISEEGTYSVIAETISDMETGEYSIFIQKATEGNFLVPQLTKGFTSGQTIKEGTSIAPPTSSVSPSEGATTILVQGNDTGKWVFLGSLISYGIAGIPIGIIFFLDKRKSRNYKASSSRWTKYITIGHTLFGFSFLFGTCWIYIFGLQAQTIPITFSFWFSESGIALFLLCTAFASASLSSFILSYALRMSTPLRWINRFHIPGAILFSLVFLIPMIIAPNSSFTKESMAPLWAAVASISAFAAIWQYRGIVEIKSPPPERKIETPPSRVSGSHHDVFISYSQQDKPVADAITVRLESQGIRCWVAPRDVIPGKNFPEAIIDAIDESRIMVLVFSSYSNNSPHVIRELTRAVSQEVIIVPFRIEDIQPSKSMAYLINVPHWLDALTPPVEKHIDKLVEIVQLLLK